MTCLFAPLQLQRPHSDTVPTDPVPIPDSIPRPQPMPDPSPDEEPIKLCQRKAEVSPSVRNRDVMLWFRECV